MFRLKSTLLLTVGILLLSAHKPVAAASPSKGLKVDRMLHQAIVDSAETQDMKEVEVEEMPVEKPVFEEDTDLQKPAADIKMPRFPVYVEEKEEERTLFKWPEEPGILYNNMMFYPSILAKLGWNSNLFANDNMDDSDIVSYLTPRLRIEIPDIRHDVTFEGAWEWRKHADNSNEDQHNVEASLDGHLTAKYGIFVPFGFSWARRHEEREDDLTQQMPDSPLREDDFKVKGGLQFKPNAFALALLGHYHKQRYEDDTAKITGAPVIRRDADRDITQLEFNTSFDLNPRNTLMLWGTVGDRDYERQNFENGGFTGPKRSSDTFSGMMSWIFDYQGLTGHMSFGLEDYNYDDPAIQDVREIVGSLELDHRIREDTTVNLQLDHSVYEDEEVVSPIIRSRFGFYVDHDFRQNILLAAGADYNFLEFNNSGRDDEIWDFRALADYFINDFLSFGAEYVYTQRDSEQDGLDFRRNMFLLRARGRL